LKSWTNKDLRCKIKNKAHFRVDKEFTTNNLRRKKIL